MSDNILITTSSFGKYDSELLNELTNKRFQIIMNPYGRKLSENEIIDLIIQYQPIGIIAGIEPLTKKVLEHAKKLKVISRCGIGLDSVDMNAAKNLDITVINTPDAPTISVAELTLGLILSLLRKIHTSHNNLCKGKWIKAMGNLLYGKSVGIIGCGRIGSYLSTLLVPFGCKILGYDPVSQPNTIKMMGLNKLISISDIITLHVPYNKKNHHLINQEIINAMKNGAVLINTARGGLIDEEALYDALLLKHLGGTALDCFEQEPYAGKLKELDNVLLVPHIGSYTKESRIIMEKQSVENLLRELKEQL